MAAETLSELLIKIRTVGDKEAKAALKEALKQTKQQEDELKKLQAKAAKEQEAANKRRQAAALKTEREFHRALEAEGKKHAREQLTAQKEAAKQITAAKKKAEQDAKTLGRQAAADAAKEAAEVRRIKDSAAKKFEAEQLAAKKAADRRLEQEQKASAQRQLAAKREEERQYRQIEREARGELRSANRRRQIAERETRRSSAAQARDRAAALESRQAAISGARTSVRGGFSSFGDRIVGGATNLARTAAVGGVGLAVGGAAALKDFVDEASELKSVASFTSLTTKRLQELNFAAEQNGVSSGLLADGLRQFNAGVREAAKSGNGTGAVAEGVADLGLDFKKLADQRPEDQLFAILEAGNRVGPSMQRAGVFAKIFGETAGAGFARLADQGVDSLRATAAQASELGFVLSGETIDGAVAAKKSLGALTSTVGGLKNSLLAELLPTVNEWLVTARNWVMSNRELIRTTVTEWAQKLGQAVKEAIPYLKDLYSLAKDLLPILVQWGPALVQIGVGLKAVSMAEKAAAGVRTLTTALGSAHTAAAGLAGATGIGAIVQGFVTLLPLAYEFGNILGNIGNQDTGPRKSIVDKIVGAEKNAKGQAMGLGGYESQLVEMTDAEFEATKTGVLSRSTGLDQGLLFQRAAKKRAAKKAEAADRDAVRQRILGAKKLSDADYEFAVAGGYLTQEEVDLDRASRRGRRLAAARKTDSEDKAVSDEELMKLIKSGANLDELLKGRKIAGGTPPVITVTQTIFNVTANATIDVKARDGQAASSVAQSLVDQFSDMLSNKIREALPRSAVAR